jgi:hypothetical protein
MNCFIEIMKIEADATALFLFAQHIREKYQKIILEIKKKNLNH